MIKIEHVNKRYRTVQALQDFSLEIPRGSIYGLIGPNGAGKTTLLRILAALISPTSGKVWFDDEEVSTVPSLIQRKVGYMPDFFGVYPDLTTVEYLEFYAGIHGIPYQKHARTVNDLLELVDLSSKRDELVETLSRGMKQRLCLARALVHDPEVLLLDEPASGLDPRARIEMRELIRELRRMGKTIFVSSHILPELEELCTWVGFIDHGRMVEAGPMEDVRGRVLAGRRLRVELVEPDQVKLLSARDLVQDRTGVVAVEVVEDGLEVAVEEGFPDEQLLTDLVNAGVGVRAFARVTGDLSEAFLRLTATTAERGGS